MREDDSQPPVARGDRADATLGAAILAGGASRRMGRDKAALELGGEPLVRRIARAVSQAAAPVVVVAAPDQQLVELPADVAVTRDAVAHEGPLMGVATGLRWLAERGVERAFVCATDAPFVHPALVRRLAREPAAEVVVPVSRARRQPLAAIYATSLHTRATTLLAGGERRLLALLTASQCHEVSAATLRADPAIAAIDPDLTALTNVNTPDDYAAARERASSEDEAAWPRE